MGGMPMQSLHWAQQDFEECLAQEKALRKAYEKSQGSEKEIISGMLHELLEKMEQLCRRLLHDPEMREKHQALSKLIEQKKKKRRLWDPEILHEIAVDECNVENEVIEKLCPDEVEKEPGVVVNLDVLPNKQRDVFLLISNGIPRGEVARMYGRKKGTINKHFTLARRRLRESLFFGQCCYKMEMQIVRPSIIDMYLRCGE